MITDARSWLVLTAVTAWQQVIQLGPFVIGGVVLAAFSGQFDLSRRLHKWLRCGGVMPVIGAACLGSISPLSTCGTIPVLMQLVRTGASPGPVLAFLAASSMLNPQLFFLILGGLGARMALRQLLGVLILSLLLGWMASHVQPALLLHPAALRREDNESLDLSPRHFVWSRSFRDLVWLTEWIGLTFIIGIILSAVLQVSISPDWVMRLFGKNRWTAVLMAGMWGIPLYTCGGSAVPVLTGLTRIGLGPAAALTFLLSGPATRATALAAMGSLLNRRALVAYVVYIVLGAMIIGLVLG